MKGIPGLPSSVSTKSTSIKYKFKNDENLNSYHNIKLQSINLNGAGVNSYAGYLKSVKIFFSTRSKRELEISSTLLTNTSMQDYILNVNDKEILDEYLKDPDLEYSIEYVLDTAFQDFNYRVDFKFIGEPVNKQETK
ncbi:hypothetical protein [Chryseobacterium sp.]|uniref:hypothetical protein n=1 Tax=Chryseobacterium sp. TaxID=1871047 RepID=UPI0025BC1045|nr:hypothetical protein [Chryseobacterium sp.]